MKKTLLFIIVLIGIYFKSTAQKWKTLSDSARLKVIDSMEHALSEQGYQNMDIKLNEERKIKVTKEELLA